MNSSSFLPFDTSVTFALAYDMTVEFFEEGALILDLRDRMLLELDAHHSWVLQQINSVHSVSHVIARYKIVFELTDDNAARAVKQICDNLLTQGIIRLMQGFWEEGPVDTKRYVQNPDVNLREEDEDGALLFNPDTDRVQLLNDTGLYIWKLCAEGRTVRDIVDAFRADYDNVPEVQVAADVEEFVSHMVDSGFIGVLELP